MKPKSSRLANSTSTVVFSIATCLVALHAKAATIYWDGTGTGWDAVGSWSTASNATTPNPAAVPVAADTVYFNISTVNTAQTVNLNANQAVTGINFQSTNTTLLQGGGTDRTLSVGTGGITVNAGAGAATIGSSTSGQGVAVTMTGAQLWSNNATSVFTVANNVTNSTYLLTLAGIGNIVINGTIGSGAGGLTSTNAGTVTLSANNTYTGATTLSTGTIQLSGTSGQISATSGLTIGGGTSFISGDTTTAANNNSVANRVKAATTLTINGGAFQLAAAAAGGTHTQSFNALAVGAGVGTINTNAATGTNTLTFSAAAASNYTRANGGLINISTQSGFNVAFTNAATSNIAGTGSDAMLIGAILNGADFIASAAGNVGAAAYTDTSTTVWTVGKNMNVTGTNGTAYAAADVNSARFNAAGANTVMLDTGTNTIAGGILVTSNVGANASTITGGTIQAASGKDLLVIQNNAASGGDFTIGSAIANNGGSALTKTGAGKLILSGLSSTAANNYAGTTTIDGGTLAITSSANLTGGLTIGAANGSTATATLDLSGASATFGGAFTVQTNSTTANTINIGSGQTLQLAGAVKIGANGSSSGTTTKLAVSGLGTLAIGTSGTPTNAGVQLGGNLTGATAVNNAATLDLSGLSTFSAYLGTGKFQVGDSVNGNGVNTNSVASTLILAANNTISAASLNTDSVSSGGGTAGNTIKLGSGTNILYVGELAVGSTTGRSNGSLVFNGSTGTVTVRSQDGAGRATLNISNMSTSATIGATGTFDVRSHYADLLLDKITISSRSAGTGGGPTGTLSFDTGILDANDLIVGNKTLANTSNFNATVNLGGTGAATFRSSTSAIILASNTSTNATVTGTMNISGTTSSVTVAANAGNSIIIGNAGTTGGTATGNLNLTGGTLTVAGDIIRGASTGTSNAVLNLNGGTLDMGGNKIGGSASSGNLTSLTFAAGTLKNVADINNGATLNKTTSGTLILGGTNSYAGATTVTTGKLLVNGSNTGSGAFTVNSSTTLGGTGSITAAVNVSGVLSPGSSIESLSSGALTMNSGSTFQYEATGNGASGADLMVVNGALSLTGVTLDLSGADLSLGTWTAGTKLTLISYTGAAISSGFTGYADDTTYTFGSNQWLFDYNDSLKGNNFASDAQAPGAGVWFVTAALVPEPAATLLGSLGLLALLRRRRCA